jgi:hypothetical protein
MACRAGDQAVESLGSFGGELNESLPSRVDVDDSVKGDDVCGRHLVGGLDEVTVQIGDASAVATALGLLARRREIGCRCVHTGRACQAGVEQLVPDRGTPPPISSGVAPLTPCAFSISMSARVEGIGPFPRYRRKSLSATFMP